MPSDPSTLPPSGPAVALIVAHGQPSDPAPAEAELAALAARVAGHLPGWHVGSATLADPGALDRALAAARHLSGQDGGLVYPMFMADGWFTRTHLPERLAAAGGRGWTHLPPFGCDPQVQDLAVAQVAALVAGEPAPGGARSLVLAAHGSFKSPAPAAVARAVAARIAAGVPGLGAVRCGFIDQSPQIAEVAAGLGPGAICLPFFAARGGHVIDDLPQALDEAGFSGTRLDPLGLHPQVPRLIATALAAARAAHPAPAA